MKAFVFPSKCVWEMETYRDNYGKMVVEPLERGYGVTIGNLLRRILLSSIPGVAVTSLRVGGVAHEFSTIPGVTEDVVDIILNLKQVALKKIVGDFPRVSRVEISGTTAIRAADLVTDGSVEVLNGDLHIATISQDTSLTVEVEITEGFGYLPAEKMRRIEKREIPIGTILIDGIYTPVRKVAFHVENTRVGQSVDYEKLLLEIWTTGAVTPKDSIRHATEIMNRHLSILKEEEIAAVETAPEAAPEAAKPDEADMATPVTELKLSTRVCNALAQKNIHTLGQLVEIPRERFEEYKNLGKKSLEEIEQALAKRGYKLKSFAAQAKHGDKDAS